MEKVKREQKGWTQAWLTQHTKACPGCKARIQRIAGCNHMICTQCHRHFCWVRLSSAFLGLSIGQR